MSDMPSSTVMKNNTLLKIENIITAVVLAVLLWVGTEVQSNGKAIVELSANQAILTTLLDNRDRIKDLELNALEQRTQLAIAQIEVSQSSLRARVEQLNNNDNTQWPRLRAINENIQILKTHIEKITKEQIQLKSPEKL
jgi:hypothetical protein